MADSTHTASWLAQLKSENWDLHVFPAEDGPIRRELSDVTMHGLFRQPDSDIHPSICQTGLRWPFRRGRTRLTRWIRASSAYMGRASALARKITALNPDIIHTLEMQRAGYLTLDAREELGPDAFPPWIFSCWGNDIYLFGRRPAHEQRVRAVLEACDFFTADCRRDLILARQFGFIGRDFGVFPGPGGFDIARMQQFRTGSPSQRKLIAIKGYQSGMWGGRGLIALQALRLCAHALSGYRVVVYFAGPDSPVGAAALELRQATGIDITLWAWTPRDEFLKLLGQARIAVALSVSDGTPNTMLEAMIMGAFPIQSDTVSTGEWIDGCNGFLVPPEDPVAVADAIRRAVADDRLVNQAADLNDRATKDRVDIGVVRPRVIEMYRRVAEWGRTQVVPRQ
jgi:glycosyltransferase involved in cell wall biosynthesis